MDSTEQQTATVDFCWQMFREYRAALKQYFLYHVVDEGRLPIDKQCLKDVMKLLMFQQWSDDEKVALHNAYAWLSKFQPGAKVVELMQQVNMQIYEECLKRDGVKLDEGERLAHLLFAAKGSVEAEELEVVDAEKRMLETELARWERIRAVEEKRQRLDEVWKQVAEHIAVLKKGVDGFESHADTASGSPMRDDRNRQRGTEITDQPRLLKSSSNPKAAAHLTPEEEELEQKRVELRILESELADRELELVNLHGDLVEFERGYMHRVGQLYAQLDDLEAQIAEAEFRRQPSNDSARTEAENSRTRARGSAAAFDNAESDDSNRRFEPSEDLKKLYREAAKTFHPDLTTDPVEKERRKKVMAELNKAYEECNEQRIRQILNEWRASPDQVKGEDTGAELVRVIRTIALVRKRLSAIKDDIEALMQSELSQLKSQVEEATKAGRDLLAEMVDQVIDRIDEAKTRLDTLMTNETVDEQRF